MGTPVVVGLQNLLELKDKICQISFGYFQFSILIVPLAISYTKKGSLIRILVIELLKIV